ncbi:MAG: ACT domain-containing protein [Oscillospiraceae bacterium]|nr:ACT domain-containing protein [Oscillospiraceae bacterium]
MPLREGQSVAEKTMPKYYLVQAEVLPEVFLKVMEAKELLQIGECATVGDATARVGISRSAFYKYKDAISPFQDLRQGRILTFQMLLRDQTGRLSAVLGVFAGCGANILTINQSIPVNGCASITISSETAGMSESVETLMNRLLATDGVLRAEVLAG